MRRPWLWLQLVFGWLPIGVVFAVLIATTHGVSIVPASVVALRMIATGALLGLLVHRLTRRFPWPRPFRLSFLALHILAAAAYSGAWLVLNIAVEALLRGSLAIDFGPGTGPYLVLGVWIYVMVAAVSYASDAAERAARAETLAAEARLAALRSQLHPHFLFNALHSVVQLIHLAPDRAAGAAAQLGALLRTAIEEDRDLVTVAEERAFVERYLELERMRFGDRLRVTVDVSDAAADALIPSFALLTLVENAVRHGAEPRVEPTDVTVRGRAENGVVTLAVLDTGGGTTQERLGAGDGTGLRRLRERLAALYGNGASLDVKAESEGVTATLVIPRRTADE